MREFMSSILYWSSFTDQPVTVGEVVRFIPWAAFAFLFLWLMCAWAAM